MSQASKDRIDYIFKTAIAICIGIAGFFCNRIVNELDEARHEIRQLEITVSNIEGMLTMKTASQR